MLEKSGHWTSTRVFTPFSYFIIPYSSPVLLYKCVLLDPNFDRLRSLTGLSRGNQFTLGVYMFIIELRDRH